MFLVWQASASPSPYRTIQNIMLNHPSLLTLLNNPAHQTFPLAYAVARTAPPPSSDAPSIILALHKAIFNSGAKWLDILERLLQHNQDVQAMWEVAKQTSLVFLGQFMNCFLDYGYSTYVSEVVALLTKHCTDFETVEPLPIQISIVKSIEIIFNRRSTPYRSSFCNDSQVLTYLRSIYDKAKQQHGSKNQELERLIKRCLKCFIELFQISEEIEAIAKYNVKDPISYFERNQHLMSMLDYIFIEAVVHWPHQNHHLNNRLVLLSTGVNLTPLYFKYSQAWPSIFHDLIIPTLLQTRSPILLQDNPTQYFYRDLQLIQARKSGTIECQAANLLVKIVKHISGSLPRILEQTIMFYSRSKETCLLILAILAQPLSSRPDLIPSVQKFITQQYKELRQSPDCTLRYLLFQGQFLPLLFNNKQAAFIGQLNYLIESIGESKQHSAVTLSGIEILRRLCGNAQVLQKMENSPYDIAHHLIANVAKCKVEEYFTLMVELVGSFKGLMRYSCRLAKAIISRILQQSKLCQSQGVSSTLCYEHCFDLLESVLSSQDTLEKNYCYFQSDLEQLTTTMYTRKENGRLLSLAGLLLYRCMDIPPFIKHMLNHLQTLQFDDASQLFPIFWGCFKHKLLQYEQKELAMCIIRLAFTCLKEYHSSAMNMKYEFKKYHEMCLICSFAVQNFTPSVQEFAADVFLCVKQGLGLAFSHGIKAVGLSALMAVTLYHYPKELGSLVRQNQQILQMTNQLLNKETTSKYMNKMRVLFAYTLAKNFNFFLQVTDQNRQSIVRLLKDRLIESLKPLKRPVEMVDIGEVCEDMACSQLEQLENELPLSKLQQLEMSVKGLESLCSDEREVDVARRTYLQSKKGRVFKKVKRW